MPAFLEISTCGWCVLSCKYCPQEKLRANYKGVYAMPFNTFKTAVDMLPTGSTVSFAGYSEPCVHELIAEMILYASERHKLMLLTTLIGLTIGEYNKIRKLRFDHFSIHLPDSEGRTKFDITDDYKKLLRHIIDNPPIGNLLFNHHEGDIHPEVKSIVKKSMLLQIYDRAGNGEYGIKKNYTFPVTCGHRFLTPEGSGVLIPNGDMQACCSDFSLKYKLGNVYKNTWAEIADSPVKALVEKELCPKCFYARRK